MNQQPVQGEVSSIGKWCEGRKRTENHQFMQMADTIETNSFYSLILSPYGSVQCIGFIFGGDTLKIKPIHCTDPQGEGIIPYASMQPGHELPFTTGNCIRTEYKPGYLASYNYIREGHCFWPHNYGATGSLSEHVPLSMTNFLPQFCHGIESTLYYLNHLMTESSMLKCIILFCPSYVSSKSSQKPCFTQSMLTWNVISSGGAMWCEKNEKTRTRIG